MSRIAIEALVLADVITSTVPEDGANLLAQTEKVRRGSPAEDPATTEI